jgi:hypothetical protein
VKLTDLRAILQYVPQFREKTFIIAVDAGIVTDENGVISFPSWPTHTFHLLSNHGRMAAPGPTGSRFVWAQAAVRPLTIAGLPGPRRRIMIKGEDSKPVNMIHLDSTTGTLNHWQCIFLYLSSPNGL